MRGAGCALGARLRQRHAQHGLAADLLAVPHDRLAIWLRGPGRGCGAGAFCQPSMASCGMDGVGGLFCHGHRIDSGGVDRIFVPADLALCACRRGRCGAGEPACSLWRVFGAAANRGSHLGLWTKLPHDRPAHAPFAP